MEAIRTEMERQKDTLYFTTQEKITQLEQGHAEAKKNLKTAVQQEVLHELRQEFERVFLCEVPVERITLDSRQRDWD